MLTSYLHAFKRLRGHMYVQSTYKLLAARFEGVTERIYGRTFTLKTLPRYREIMAARSEPWLLPSPSAAGPSDPSAPSSPASPPSLVHPRTAAWAHLPASHPWRPPLLLPPPHNRFATGADRIEGDRLIFVHVRLWRTVVVAKVSRGAIFGESRPFSPSEGHIRYERAYRC